MPEIRMRAKNQFTLPASLVRESGIEVDDKLSVDLVNGSIVITPMGPKHQGLHDGMAFAGIAEDVWGDNPKEVEQTIQRNMATW